LRLPETSEKASTTCLTDWIPIDIRTSGVRATAGRGLPKAAELASLRMRPTIAGSICSTWMISGRVTFVALAQFDHLERRTLGRRQVAAGFEFDELAGVEHGSQGVCNTTAALLSVSSR
jgi:hypothetical protein